MDAGIQSTPRLVSTTYQDHELVRGRIFFLLPRKLLELVLKAVGRDRFELKAIQMEEAMSTLFAGGTVGLWDGYGVNFPLLDRRRFELSNDDIKFMHPIKPVQETRDQIRIAEDRADVAANNLLGYSGWLLTNPMFLREHDDLFANTTSVLISQFGIPRIGTVLNSSQLLEPTAARSAAAPSPISDERLRLTAEQLTGIDKWQAFLVRWRLMSVSAPYLLTPIGPHLPVVHLGQVMGHLRESGQVCSVETPSLLA